MEIRTHYVAVESRGFKLSRAGNQPLHSLKRQRQAARDRLHIGLIKSDGSGDTRRVAGHVDLQATFAPSSARTERRPGEAYNAIGNCNRRSEIGERQIAISYGGRTQHTLCIDSTEQFNNRISTRVKRPKGWNTI